MIKIRPPHLGKAARSLLASAALLSLLSSCGRETIVVPDDPTYPTSGVASIDSRQPQGYQGSGFYFATAQVIYYPNTSQVFPDLPVTVSSATGYQPRFWSIDGNSAFKLLDSLSDSAQAWAYFDSLLVLSDTAGFSGSLSGIARHQTIAVRADGGKYAKVLITRAEIIDSSIAEVTFRWAYQPSGSTAFPSR
jgi:hypothetical protein